MSSYLGMLKKMYSGTSIKGTPSGPRQVSVTPQKVTIYEKSNINAKSLVWSSFSKEIFGKFTLLLKNLEREMKDGLFSNRISLTWNWQSDFCYETTHIQPHRSTSKFVTKGPTSDISRTRSKCYSLFWYLFTLLIFKELPCIGAVRL